MDGRVLVGLAALGGVLLVGHPLPVAAAHRVDCGSSITASTQLTADLRCAEGDGLVLAASGTEGTPVVLDLNGHTISGADQRGTAGIRFTGQHHVVVRGGTIAGFDVGVELEQSTRVTLTGLTVDGQDRGIDVAGGGYHLIEKNSVTGRARDGIRLGATTNNYVTKNTVVDSHWGISIAGYTTSNFINQNIVTDSTRHGIGAFDNARAVTIVQNKVSGNDYGIFIGWEVDEVWLERNEATGNRTTGIRVDSDTATLVDNVSQD